MLIIITLIICILYFTKQYINWVKKPFNEKHIDMFEDDYDIEVEDKEGEENLIEVKIQKDKINTNSIVEYRGETFKSFNWRPKNFGEFIGQEESKHRAITIIKKAKRGMKAHFILSAIQGHGKSLFVELVAKTLGAKLITRIGNQLDLEELVKVINEINTATEKYVVFFLDEIDTTDWRVLKTLNPVLEEFMINNRKIRPFVFSSATINKHILVKNNPDFLDRIPHHIQFSRYNNTEIATILNQYIEQVYPDEKVSGEVIKIVSSNSKFNPRKSLSLAEDFIVEQDMKRVLKNNKIVKDGLDTTDLKVLEVLNKETKAMGATALALRAGLSQADYIRTYEPFLYEFGYINRIPSRVISDKGKQLLKEIQELKC